MVVGYACIGTNDLAKAKKFYEELLAPLGGKHVADTPRGHYFQGTLGGGLLITIPADGKACSPGNGNTVGLLCPSRKVCSELYHKALSMGCTDEGPVGLRGEEGPTALYIGYIRDPDGNKLAFYLNGGPDS